MAKCSKSGGFFRHVSKFIPTVVLIALTVVAGGTDVFSSVFHQLVAKSLSDWTTWLAPHLVTLLLGATALSLAHVAHGYLSCWLGDAMDGWSVSDDLKNFMVGLFRVLYWIAITYFTIAFFLPELMGKLGEGVLLFMAALGVALQGYVNDLCAGLLMRGFRLVRVGDFVQLKNGNDACGRVLDISSMRTRVKTDKGERSIRNTTVWNADVEHPEAAATPGGQSLSEAAPAAGSPKPAAEPPSEMTAQQACDEFTRLYVNAENGIFSVEVLELEGKRAEMAGKPAALSVSISSFSVLDAIPNDYVVQDFHGYRLIFGVRIPDDVAIAPSVWVEGDGPGPAAVRQDDPGPPAPRRDPESPARR